MTLTMLCDFGCPPRPFPDHCELPNDPGCICSWVDVRSFTQLSSYVNGPQMTQSVGDDGCIHILANDTCHFEFKRSVIFQQSRQ